MSYRYDFWQNEREAADVLDTGVRVLRGDNPPTVKLWRPKATKPAANYRFRSAEQREQYVADFARKFEAELAAKAERRAARKPTAEQLAQVEVGSIFCYSWGYDQTNIEFFEVVEKHGQRVVVREIGSEVHKAMGPYSEMVVARPGAFLANKKPLTKTVRFMDGRPYLSQPYGWCGLWEGRPTYSSSYA